MDLLGMMLDMEKMFSGGIPWYKRKFAAVNKITRNPKYDRHQGAKERARRQRQKERMQVKLKMYA